MHALQAPGAFPSGIYWVTNSERDLLPSVRELLKKAVEKGINAVVVESHNFDELAADLANEFALPDALHGHVFNFRPTPVLRPVPLPSGDALRFPVLRCSALLIDKFPLEARRLTLANTASTAQLRELLREAKVYAVVASTGREVAAFGPDDKLITALASLGARLNGTIALRPDADSWALGLLYDALTRALCRRKPLLARMRRSGHAVIVAQDKLGEISERTTERCQRLAKLQLAYDSPLCGTVPELGFPYNEGVRLRLEHCADRWWCVFDPFTSIEVPNVQKELLDNEDAGKFGTSGFHRGDPAGDWRRERWARKYNLAWTKIIDAWAQLLCNSDDGTIRAFGISEKTGVDAVFGLSNVTAWCRPAHKHAYFERRN